mmetsp:Transcript_98430/g.278917  ORF Transcript_98430/g.278917 Transcript_98430/m.278917 type:complete len:263 (+) Transcript_98430:187-975(+)
MSGTAPSSPSTTKGSASTSASSSSAWPSSASRAAVSSCPPSSTNGRASTSGRPSPAGGPSRASFAGSVPSSTFTSPRLWTTRTGRSGGSARDRFAAHCGLSGGSAGTLSTSIRCLRLPSSSKRPPQLLRAPSSPGPPPAASAFTPLPAERWAHLHCCPFRQNPRWKCQQMSLSGPPSACGLGWAGPPSPAGRPCRSPPASVAGGPSIFTPPAASPLTLILYLLRHAGATTVSAVATFSMVYRPVVAPSTIRNWSGRLSRNWM